MNIAKIIDNATNAYDGIACEIYVSGCNRGCPGCHSPAAKDFNYGKPLDIPKLLKRLNKYRDWFDIISLLGGDPLCQDNKELMRLVVALSANFPDKKLWLFTGAELDEVPLWCKEFFAVIKTGRYDATKKQAGFPASSNQKINRKGIDY